MKMKFIHGIVWLFFILFVLAEAETYSLVRVEWNENDLIQIASEGYDIANVVPKSHIDIVCTEKELLELYYLIPDLEVIHPDLVHYYQSRSKTSLRMMGYRTYSETIALMDSLHLLYPNIVSNRESIATTWDGNYLWVQKISDNPTVDEAEPEVFYDALIHAREAISHEQLLYFMRYLCENYGTDEMVTYLVDNRELWFLPIVNPDGYLYNESEYPDGGGMWRKNRRNNGGGSYGVDLNRNFGYMWGYDDLGSCPDPDDLTYRGPYAFSEPETQGYRDFVNSHEFILNISYHSYAGMYIFPWGYSYDLCDDHSLFMEIGANLTAENGYIFGPAAATIYLGNGVTNDWAYGDTTGHDKIFAFICEVGGDDDGFWPSSDRVLPLCETTLSGNLKLAELAGACLNIVNFTFNDTSGNSNGYPDPGEEIELIITIRNIGLKEGYDIYLKSLSYPAEVTVLNDSSWYGYIPSQGNRADSLNPIKIHIDEHAESGLEIELPVFTRDSSGYFKYDTLKFTIGTPNIIFEDNFDDTYTHLFSITGPDWEWGIPTSGPEIAHSEPNCWATDLSGNYSNFSNSVLRSPNIYIPSGYTRIILEFWHWYMFEGDGLTLYDGGNVQIKRVSEEDYTIISSETGYDGIISSGNIYLRDDSAFSGSSPNWEKIEFNLSDYVGDSISFQFEVGSDAYLSYPGWYIDDIQIRGYSPTDISLDEPPVRKLPDKMEMSVFPNPFNSTQDITISFSKSTRVSIELYNINGYKVSTIINKEFESGSHTIKWRASNLSSGIYFIKASSSFDQAAKKVLLIK
ncbi:T9SS type A sorting domain-containing protein [bacterium]|nr:T9SS type A sorting domain-containing protein [bacterium]